jgi:DNA-binding transcriptional MerR regulator
MSHCNAKQVLTQANGIQERQSAIESAMKLGMPIDEIERYLDWLDSNPKQTGHAQHAPRSPAADEPTEPSVRSKPN